MTKPVTRQQSPAKPDIRETTSGTPNPNASPNGQVPLRGKTASDEEVRRISRESMRRNHRLGELLAR